VAFNLKDLPEGVVETWMVPAQVFRKEGRARGFLEGEEGKISPFCLGRKTSGQRGGEAQ